ncbi:MAG: hypothetical protein V4557_12610 [Bacteroidota bacterium]
MSKKIRQPKQKNIGVQSPANLPVKKDNFFTKGFDHKTIIALVALAVAISALLLNRSFNQRREENEKATISVQMGIKPSERTDSSGRHKYYESWYLFMNTGKATTKLANIAWLLNNKYVDYHSSPNVSGTTHGVDIETIKDTSPDFREIKIKDLPPGVGFLVTILHRVKDEYIDEMYQTWKINMWDKTFSEHFLSEITIAGEKVEIKNEGITELRNMQ